MQQVNVEEAQTQLPDLIEAAVRGEEVLIAKDDQHVIKLVPISQVKPRPQFGSAQELISMTEDFDEPLADFAEYVK